MFQSTSLEDHDLAVDFVSEGAEDFVNKNLIREKPELLRDALEFAACRHHLHAEGLKDKDEVISWLSGGYSMK